MKRKIKIGEQRRRERLVAEKKISEETKNKNFALLKSIVNHSTAIRKMRSRVPEIAR